MQATAIAVAVASLAVAGDATAAERLSNADDLTVSPCTTFTGGARIVAVR